GRARTAGAPDMAVRRLGMPDGAGRADVARVVGVLRLVIESGGRLRRGGEDPVGVERQGAFDVFTEWMQGPDAVQTVHEACIIARRPAQRCVVGSSCDVRAVRAPAVRARLLGSGTSVSLDRARGAAAARGLPRGVPDS